MPCALFGKLVAKRDFISINTPRDLLLSWEAWLQGSLAVSKNELQGNWLRAYLHAPLWRFWLGPEICGMPVKGVFMSSMDGVGRHFPLTVFAFPEAGLSFDPPTDGLDQSWYVAAEDFLLATIDAGENYDAVLALFAALGESPALAPTPMAGCQSLHGALIAVPPQPVDPSGSAGAWADDPGHGVERTEALVPGDEQHGLMIAEIAADIVSGAHPDGDVPVTEGDVPGPPGGCGALTGEPADSEPSADGSEAGPGFSSTSPAEEGAGTVDLAEAQADEPPAPGPIQDASASDPPISDVGGQHVFAGFGLAELHAEHVRQTSRNRSFWWTVGGHDMPAMAMSAQGLPDMQLMSRMLVGMDSHVAR